MTSCSDNGLWKSDASDSRNYWDAQLKAAKDLMECRRHIQSVLVEIAAQHPLVDGSKPGIEFAARLDKGIQVFHDNTRNGMHAEIYVPGSRHMYNGKEDELSLSEAGVSYLRERGIPDHALHGQDLNIRYKGDSGVYGSADECYVAASYFKDQEFGQLASVCSPAQVMRKALHYIAFGVLPLCYAEPVDVMFHSYVDEAFRGIPHVLFEDHDLQSSDSAGAAVRRAQRRP